MKRIYNQLRDDLTYGKFRPGEHLSDKFLSETYGVSRLTIREVVSQLAGQGYLTREKNQGSIVTKLSVDDIDVSYNILMRCEAYAAKLFAEMQHGSLISELEKLHEKMQQDAAKLNYKTWLQLNDSFHEVIYSNCGSSVPLDIIFHIRLRTYRYRVMMMSEQKAINLFNKHHGKILAAICKGKAELAEKYMLDHLSIARDYKIGILRNVSSLL